jgi:DNA helicase-2/ATP-dependent DNA helicase PcrA
LFIEPNSEGAFDKKLINIKPEHEEIVKAQIRETWEKIQDHDFYTGCGKPECRWCEFVKEHKLYVSLLEGEEVAEEPLNPLRMVE